MNNIQCRPLPLTIVVAFEIDDGFYHRQWTHCETKYSQIQPAPPGNLLDPLFSLKINTTKTHTFFTTNNKHTY